MAKLRMFSILDGKTSTYCPPFMDLHVGIALRRFADLANDGASLISKYPMDFAMYEIGSFDDQTAVVETFAKPVFVQSAVEAKHVPANELPLGMSRDPRDPRLAVMNSST